MSKKILHLAVADGSYIITDEHNQFVSIEDAKKLVADNQIWDCNIAFQRLATEFDWSIEKLKQFYKENPQ